MAGIPKEHDSLYFDALIRTQKKESLEAMIKATYYAKKNYDNEEDVKSDIAKRLESAYGLLRDNVKGYDNGVGSYTGTIDQFQSQYTLGHEMAIWTNSSLDLNPLATKVAENKITVVEYMDIIFLNYFQPVNGKNVHPLYQILDYLLKHNKTVLEKSEIENALGVPCGDGAKNALFNLLGDTSYFDIEKNALVFSEKDSIKSILKKCDNSYIGKEGYAKSKAELKDNNKYMNYIINPHNEIIVSEDANEIKPLNNFMASLIDIQRTPRINTIYPLNFILYGAPGTGKTYSTSEYAVGIIENFDINETNMSRNEITEKYRYYIDKGQIVFTTFHQNYGYEEFIQGLRPDTSSNELSFKVCDGVFKSIADKALRDDQNDYVIIIDEINRGNISRVFGELITLIEEDKRWGEANEMYVTLPYGELFTVPNNLYIIGTMNSADKSISLVDTALRRRFSFIEKSPDLNLIADDELRKVVNALNEYIIKELRSSDLVIGHSFFIGKTVKDLDTIMNEQIIPLLYEYFFEDEQKVKKALDAVSIAHYEDFDENGEKITYVFTTSQKVFGRLRVCVEKKVGVNN